MSWSGVGHCTPSASRSRCPPISSVSRHLTLSFPSRQSPKVISKRYDSILNMSSTITSWLFEWSSHLNCQLLDFLNSTRKLLWKVHFLRQRLVLLTVVVGSDTVNWLASENVAQSVLGQNTISPTGKPIIRVVYSTLMYLEWSCLVGEFGSDELSKQWSRPTTWDKTTYSTINY